MLIEPSASCNLHCSRCFRYLRTDKEGHMKLSLFKHILTVNKDKFIWLGGAGEAFLNPDILEMIDIAHSDKRVIAMTNNGTVLTNDYIQDNLNTLKKINRLEISADSNSNRALRDMQPKILLRTILYLNRLGIKCRRAILLSEINWKEIKLIIRWCKSNNIKSSWMFTSPHFHNDLVNAERLKFCIIHQHEFLTDLKKGGLGSDLIDLGNSFCTRIPEYHSELSFLWSGLVVPCCYRLDQKYAIGNIEKDSLKKILESKEIKKIRSGRHWMCKICNEIDLFRRNPYIYLRKREGVHY